MSGGHPQKLVGGRTVGIGFSGRLRDRTTSERLDTGYYIIGRRAPARRPGLALGDRAQSTPTDRPTALAVDHVKYTDKTRSVIRRRSDRAPLTVIVSYAIVRLINSARNADDYRASKRAVRLHRLTNRLADLRALYTQYCLPPAPQLTLSTQPDRTKRTGTIN